MRLTFTYWTPVVLVAVVLLGISHAHATSLTQNGVTIVSDDFENVAAGQPAVAEVGTWAGNSFNRPIGQVINTAPIPGPAQGSNYLTTAPLTYSGVGANNFGSLGVDLTLNTGDQLEWSSEVYVPTVSSSGIQWEFNLQGFEQFDPPLVDGPVLFNFWRNPSGTWQTNTGTAFTPPTAFARDVWQNWDVKYTVGAPTVTLSINGTTATIPTDITSVDTSTPYRMFIFSNGPDRPIFLDAAVPYASPPNPGDVNLDGQVNQLDLNIVNSHFLQNGQTRATGDLNGDGQVNQLDLNLVNGNWLGTGGTGSLTAVPEPSAFVLLGFGASVLLWRRRLQD